MRTLSRFGNSIAASEFLRFRLHWVGVAFYGVRGFSFVAWSAVCRGFLLVREGDRSCWFRLSGFS